MLETMFSSSISIPKLNTPKLVVSDSGYIVESNNLYTSGKDGGNKNETVADIYSENEKIQLMITLRYYSLDLAMKYIKDFQK